MGISGTFQRNYVIARRGSIARIEDTLTSNATTFLIDAFCFPAIAVDPSYLLPISILFRKQRLKTRRTLSEWSELMSLIQI